MARGQTEQPSPLRTLRLTQHPDWIPAAALATIVLQSATQPPAMPAESSPAASARLRNFDPTDFLAQYWQRRPLLVRGALPADYEGVATDALIGLAATETVESRCVQRTADQSRWDLESGPFKAGVLSPLPSANWTLLVQAVDLWVPRVREVLAAFDFLPQWRMDDVMVSLATPGGGVGPHVDQYDVFLLQLQGSREWHIGSHQDPASAQDMGSAPFEPTETWVVEPGDMLYLPPGVPHWGTAITVCQTWSVGFRAPSLADMLGDLAIELMAQDNDTRFTDPPLTPSMASEQVDPAYFERARGMLRQLLEQENLIEDWFCRYMTEPKYPDLLHRSGETRRASFKNQATDTSLMRYRNGEPEE